METKAVIEPTRVMALIAEIREATDAHAGIVKAQGAASARAEELTAGIGRMHRGIEDQERALAVSGAPLPADPFPEEAQISLLQRELRVVKARIGVLTESAEASQAKLSELRKALRGAWHDFALATCKEQRQRFREAGMLLRNLYCEQLAYLAVFGRIQGIPGAEIAIVGDPENLTMSAEFGALCDSRYLDPKSVWEKLAGPRYAELNAIRDRVKAAGASV